MVSPTGTAAGAAAARRRSGFVGRNLLRQIDSEEEHGDRLREHRLGDRGEDVPLPAARFLGEQVSLRVEQRRREPRVEQPARHAVDHVGGLVGRGGVAPEPHTFEARAELDHAEADRPRRDVARALHLAVAAMPDCSIEQPRSPSLVGYSPVPCPRLRPRLSPRRRLPARPDASAPRRPLRVRDADPLARRADGGVRARRRPIRRSPRSCSRLLARLRRPPDAALRSPGACRRREVGGARIYLKREDLCHTGAHKINNAHRPGAARRAAWASRASSRRPAPGSTASRPPPSCALFGLRVRGLHGRGGRASARR